MLIEATSDNLTQNHMAATIVLVRDQLGEALIL